MGAAEGEPLRLTTHPKNDRAPAWSPDGQRLGFLSERDDKAQVFLMDVRGGEAWKVTEAKAGVQAFAWSPDGKAIAYLAPDPPSDEDEKKTKAKDDEQVVDRDFKMANLWTVDVESRKEAKVAGGDFTLADPRWSPDGRWIAVVRRPTPKADDEDLADIVLVPASGGPPRLLYENAGADTMPRFSPDGTQVAFLSRDGALSSLGNPLLMVVPVAGGTPRALTDVDVAPSAVSWSADGRSLLFASPRGVRLSIYGVPATGGPPHPVVDGAFSAGAVSVARKVPTIAFLRHDPDHPLDVWVQASGKPAVQRSHLNPQVASFSLGKGQSVRWKSFDGREIEGVLWLPADHVAGKALPLIVQAHGGPAGALTLGFPGQLNNYAHCYAGRGWGVFQPNFRGSGAYGDAFIRLNVNDWGGGDFKDMMTGVDHLIQIGIADKDRLAIHGWSYGGFMTAFAITHTDRFKAASVGAGLTNMISMYSTNDLPGVVEDYFGSQPWQDYERYERASAVYHIRNAGTPTLILHGEKDERVPVGQGRELYIGLRDHKVPVEMVVYPREPHGLREPNHQLDKMEREMALFEKYLH